MLKVNIVIGIFIALGLMVTSLVLTFRYIKNFTSEEKMMFIFVYIVIIMANSFVIDNFIATNVELLDKDENKAVLQVLTGIVNIVIGWMAKSFVDKQSDKNTPKS